MKKIIAIMVSIFLLTGWFLPKTSASEVDFSFCNQYNGISKITWNGVELKPGQIGLLIVIKDTPLFKLNNEEKIFSRTLKAKEVYRIFSFKPGMLGVGGGYFVERNSKVSYQTPSKQKLDAVKCINGTHLTQKYPKELNTEELLNTYHNLNLVYEKAVGNGYKDYISLVKELEPSIAKYRNLNLSVSQKYIFNEMIMKIERVNMVDCNTKMGFIIVRFNNNEAYYAEFPFYYKKISDEYYLDPSSLSVVYSILTNGIKIKKEPQLLGGLSGKIISNRSYKIERVYKDISDLNSEFYNNYSLDAEGFPSFSEFDSRILKYPTFSVYSTVSLNNLLLIGKNNPKAKVNNNIIEIQIDESPDQYLN